MQVASSLEYLSGESSSSPLYNMPDYICKNPKLSCTVPHILPMLQFLREDLETKGCNAGYELEARFGLCTTSEFKSGVSKEFWDSTLNRIEEFESWKSISPWAESHDYFYTLPNRTTVRTTVRFREDKAHLEKIHITKRNIKSVTFKKLTNNCYFYGQNGMLVEYGRSF